MEEQKKIGIYRAILTFVILFLPSFYSYKNVPLIIQEYRLMSFTWQLSIVIGEFGESLLFIPFSFLFVEPIVLLYLPTFYIIPASKQYMNGEYPKRDFSVLILLSLLLPWLTAIFPFFLTWYPDSVIFFPLPGFVGLILLLFYKPKTELWSEIAIDNSRGVTNGRK